MSYDESIKVSPFPRCLQQATDHLVPFQQSLGSAESKANTTSADQTAETSPISSRTSSPDSQRRSSRHDSIGSSMSGGSYSTPQINFLQKQKEMREQQMQNQQQNSPPSPQSPQSTGSSVYSPDKPPIPPRGAPPPVPQRQSSNENMNVTIRSRNVNGKFLLNFEPVTRGLILKCSFQILRMPTATTETFPVDHIQCKRPMATPGDRVSNIDRVRNPLYFYFQKLFGLTGIRRTKKSQKSQNDIYQKI